MVICCIGTPKIKGDSIAPKVGDMLIQKDVEAFVYGTTSRPVTAINYPEYLRHIRRLHQGETVIAVDAALGRKENIGRVSIVRGGVHPGGAMNKNLSKIGTYGLLAQIGDYTKDPMSELNSAQTPLVESLADKCVNLIINILDMIKISGEEKLEEGLAKLNIPS